MGSLHFTPALLWTCLLLSSLYSIYSWFDRYNRRREFMRVNGCKPSYKCYPIREPFTASDMRYKIIRAATQKKLLAFWRGALEKYDYTYTTSSLAGTAVTTAEPANAKAVFSINFADWSVAPGRQGFKPALGASLFMVDGPSWSHSRSLMRPIFMKDNLAKLDLLEGHVQALLRLLPGDGSTVDLQPLFLRLAMDVSTEFVFGQSTHTLQPDRSDSQAQLHADFDLVMQDALDRVRFGKMYPMLKNQGAAAAVRNVHLKAEGYVKMALARNAEREKGELLNAKTGNYSFLDELARQTGDEDRMRDEAVTLLVGGRDTTASLLSHLWFLLAKHPKVWHTLLAEVDQLNGAVPDYEWIKNAKYLRHCEHEALRLFPVIPQFPPRIANRDTVIPIGGGHDGKSPLHVPQGCRFNFSQWTANRRKDLWGDDAEDFRPDRWDSIRPGWNYIPFGGGPRACIGQQFALTEVYYVTVRLMQHLRRIECRDDNQPPWVEKFSTTLNSGNGVLVALYDA